MIHLASKLDCSQYKGNENAEKSVFILGEKEGKESRRDGSQDNWQKLKPKDACLVAYLDQNT